MWPSQGGTWPPLQDNSAAEASLPRGAQLHPAVPFSLLHDSAWQSHGFSTAFHTFYASKIASADQRQHVFLSRVIC